MLVIACFTCASSEGILLVVTTEMRKNVPEVYRLVKNIVIGEEDGNANKKGTRDLAAKNNQGCVIFGANKGSSSKGELGERPQCHV